MQFFEAQPTFKLEALLNFQKSVDKLNDCIKIYNILLPYYGKYLLATFIWKSYECL